MANYLRLMRIRHYIKNLLVFLPIVFAGKLFDFYFLSRSLLGFATFSLLASAVYIVNDICDLEYDRKHAVKKNRPLASGEIGVKNAAVLAAALGFAAVAMNAAWNNSPFSWLFLIVYALINSGYSFGLKNIPFVDISIIVAGFVLRVSYGGAIVGIAISSWLYLTVVATSFYLALGKRRNEIRKNSKTARTVLKYYTEKFLDKMMYISLALSIVFYSLWCIAPGDSGNKSIYLIWTVPLVMLICKRYSVNIEGDSYADPAEVLLGDKVLIRLVLVYGFSLILLIYNLKLLSTQGL